MALSRKQLALIHIAKKAVGMSEEDYRRSLMIAGDVDSARDLDQPGFEILMQYMQMLGFRSDYYRTAFGHRDGMATPRQVALIRRLWEEYTAGQGDDASLGKWLDRTFHVAALRFVTRELAPKVIAALMAMKRREAEKARQAG